MENKNLCFTILFIFLFPILGVLVFKSIGLIYIPILLAVIIPVIAVFLYILFSITLFKLKYSQYKNFYGTIEIGLGILTGILGIGTLLDGTLSTKPILTYLVFFSSLYVAVRGLESVHKSYLDKVEDWKIKVHKFVEDSEAENMTQQDILKGLPSAPKPTFLFWNISDEEPVVIKIIDANTVEEIVDLVKPK